MFYFSKTKIIIKDPPRSGSQEEAAEETREGSPKESLRNPQGRPKDTSRNP